MSAQAQSKKESARRGRERGSCVAEEEREQREKQKISSGRGHTLWPLWPEKRRRNRHTTLSLNEKTLCQRHLVVREGETTDAWQESNWHQTAPAQPCHCQARPGTCQLGFRYRQITALRHTGSAARNTKSRMLSGEAGPRSRQAGKQLRDWQDVGQEKSSWTRYREIQRRPRKWSREVKVALGTRRAWGDPAPPCWSLQDLLPADRVSCSQDPGALVLARSEAVSSPYLGDTIFQAQWWAVLSQSCQAHSSRPAEQLFTRSEMFFPLILCGGLLAIWLSLRGKTLFSECVWLCVRAGSWCTIPRQGQCIPHRHENTGETGPALTYDKAPKIVFWWKSWPAHRFSPCWGF